jgi:hypothetical protein
MAASRMPVPDIALRVNAAPFAREEIEAAQACNRELPKLAHTTCGKLREERRELEKLQG